MCFISFDCTGGGAQPQGGRSCAAASEADGCVSLVLIFVGVYIIYTFFA